MSKSILVGMSGGVDSSVSAGLLSDMGYSVSGVNLVMHGSSRGCGNGSETELARKISEELNIPFHVIDLTDEFRNTVIDDFVSVYENAGTPNPCVRCNKYIKFPALTAAADKIGCKKIATGHYAVIQEHNGRFLLKKGVDAQKDQSYVLYGLTQDLLSRTVFPLGGFTKEQIREIAAERGYINAEKHDSQDICFIPDGDYAAYIESYTGHTFEKGSFVTRDGRILGQHKGIIHYTVGQRRGLGLALPAPLYVLEKDIKRNLVILGENEKLFSRSLEADGINFIPFDRLNGSMRVKARIRYNQPEKDAVLEQIGENSIHLEFDEPQRAIAKGQSVVFYDGDYVIGGGIIR